MRQRWSSFFLLIVLLPALSGCSRSAGLFSEQNARVHVATLAGTIGSRPVGTEANARARAYVIDQLKLFGYDVRVQEIDARRAELGRTARVANIIAVLPGTKPEAIGLLSHYDSAPESPGAADDGLGVAVSLEAARVLAARTDRTWTIFVLVTDGEEMGLMGAAALMTDREVTSRLQAYINVEATGSGGTALLFETGPANGWLIGPWARRAPHPRGASFGIEIYRRLPNDTDFTILARHGIPGLNFALVGDGYAYHTARDMPERLTPTDACARPARTSWRSPPRSIAPTSPARTAVGRDLLRHRRRRRRQLLDGRRLGDRRDFPALRRDGGRPRHRRRRAHRGRLALGADGDLVRARPRARGGRDGRRHVGAARRAGGLSPVVRRARIGSSSCCSRSGPPPPGR